LLKLLLINDDLVGWLEQHLEPEWLVTPVAREIVDARLAAQRNGTWVSVTSFLDQFASSEVQAIITEAVFVDRAVPNQAQQMADVTLRLRNQRIDRQLESLTQRLSQPGLSPETELEMLREQQALRGLKRQPLRPRDSSPAA
jgi:hypothetical protein